MKVINEMDFKSYKCRASFEPECVAYNEYYEIWLSSEDGDLTLTVLQNGEPIDEATVCLWKDVEEYIDEYIYLAADIDEEQEFEIECSENALDETVEYFIASVVEENEIPDEVIQECKEHFLEYLYRNFKFTIHRPMILTDENDEDFYEEYPYECLIFDKRPVFD